MLLICPIIVLLATVYFSWFESVIVSAEGRVEHQKVNQLAAGCHLVECLVFNSITHVEKKVNGSPDPADHPHIMCSLFYFILKYSHQYPNLYYKRCLDKFHLGLKILSSWGSGCEI